MRLIWCCLSDCRLHNKHHPDRSHPAPRSSLKPMNHAPSVELPSLDEIEIVRCSDTNLLQAIDDLFLDKTISPLLYRLFSRHTFCAIYQDQIFGYIIIGAQKPLLLFALSYLCPCKIPLPLKPLLRYSLLREPSILHIVVARKFRRRGLATKLMDFAESYFKEKLDVRSVHLTVRKKNPHSIEIYKKRGYEIYGSTFNGKKYKMKKCL